MFYYFYCQKKVYARFACAECGICTIYSFSCGNRRQKNCLITFRSKEAESLAYNFLYD